VTSTREAAMGRTYDDPAGRPRPDEVEPRYVKVSRAAEVLDCDVRTVYRLVSDGLLPAIRLGRRALRINLADLDGLRHDPTRTARDAAAAAAGHPRPRARAPRGHFARKARGIS